MISTKTNATFFLSLLLNSEKYINRLGMQLEHSKLTRKNREAHLRISFFNKEFRAVKKLLKTRRNFEKCFMVKLQIHTSDFLNLSVTSFPDLPL